MGFFEVPYSFIVSALVAVVKPALLFAGQFVSLGVWDKPSEIIASASIAIALGVLLSFFLTNDSFFCFARWLKLTSRTAYPSEWYGAFASKPPKYVVLHLEGSRRITGYPIEWPSEPTTGHFRLTDAAWLDEENREISLDANDSILISAKQVEMVELLKNIEDSKNAAKNS